jgi:ribosomal protein L11 methyltransferase
LQLDTGFWNLSLECSSTEIEDFSELLSSLGAVYISVEDAWQNTDKEIPVFNEPVNNLIGDIQESSNKFWQQNHLTAMFDNKANIDIAMQCLAKDFPKYLIRVDFIEDQDWVLKSQQQFEPIIINRDFAIVPSWCEVPAGVKQSISLDPGVSFGTGSHPTTRLCLEWLCELGCTDKSVLDYGCGSGILAISAAKLGAYPVVAIDIDPSAVASALNNTKLNGIELVAGLPEDQLDTQVFDIVIANILANPLRVLAPLLAEKTKSGGYLILSGILYDQLEELKSIYHPWFNIMEHHILDGWIRLVGIKN